MSDDSLTATLKIKAADVESSAESLDSPWDADFGDWHVLHVKSRQEKALSEDLRALRVPHYLPLRRFYRMHGGRRAVVEEPMFAGYVFIRGRTEDAYRADRTRRVAKILRVFDQARLGWELRNLRIAASSETRLDPFPALRTGVRVEVRNGPMQGLQGYVRDRVSLDRIILQVKMLGSAVSLEIDGARVDLLD